MDLEGIVADLAAEHEALDAVLAQLTPEQWHEATPSPRWSVADQIGHLAYFDHTAAVAIADPDGFAGLLDELWAAAAGGDAGVDEATLGWSRAMEPEELLAEWRSRRVRLLDAASRLDEGVRVPWYGPSMSPKSFVTARLMETWAHGQDVVDAVGGHRPPSDRLEHVARLGVATRGWTYANRGEDAPAEDVRVELVAPSGRELAWGSEDATQRVRGGLEDFCLVVTQRRHVDATSLEVSGDAARDWMLKAQAFAGPPTEGPSRS